MVTSTNSAKELPTSPGASGDIVRLHMTSRPAHWTCVFNGFITRKTQGLFFLVVDFWGKPPQNNCFGWNLNDMVDFFLGGVGNDLEVQWTHPVDTVEGWFYGSFLSHYLRQVFIHPKYCTPNISEASTVTKNPSTQMNPK